MEQKSKFIYTADDFIKNPVEWVDSGTKYSPFDIAILQAWDEAVDKGLFRYKLINCKYKSFDLSHEGSEIKLPCVAQLNPQRGFNRRKRDLFNTMNDMFDPSKFNFTKINDQEILLEIIPCNTLHSQDEPKIGTTRHKILLNISPIEYGHILIVPNVDDGLPQRLTWETILLAFDLVQLSSQPGFRVSFNSLHAWASVNHLHLHAMYSNYELFADVIDVEEKICGNCYLIRCSSPLPALVFNVPDEGEDRIKIAKELTKVTEYLHSCEIPYNLVVSRGKIHHKEGISDDFWTTRAILWPRKSTKNLDPSLCFDVACVEVSGQFPIKTEEAYNSLDSKKAKKILQEAALEENKFNEILSAVQVILS